MLGRRSFLSLVSAVGALGVFAKAQDARADDSYEPAGLLEPNTIAAAYVSHVTLDGVKQEHVLRAHDAEGWVIVLVDWKDKQGRTHYRQKFRRGVVRYHYVVEPPDE